MQHPTRLYARISFMHVNTIGHIRLKFGLEVYYDPGKIKTHIQRLLEFSRGAHITPTGEVDSLYSKYRYTVRVEAKIITSHQIILYRY